MFHLLFHVFLLDKLLYLGPKLMYMFIKCCNLFPTFCWGHIVFWYFPHSLNLKIMTSFFHCISNNIVVPPKRCSSVVTNLPSIFFPWVGCHYLTCDISTIWINIFNFQLEFNFLGIAKYYHNYLKSCYIFKSQGMNHSHMVCQTKGGGVETHQMFGPMNCGLSMLLLQD
jgi:hypothetical protein